mmetsp:Transcript_115907/g.210849  ORF Transcript_115907/g.210849 Transcript_115907/m.210849 type:complete len:911 (+) Transcript_115907:105-2837(+)
MAVFANTRLLFLVIGHSLGQVGLYLSYLIPATAPLVGDEDCRSPGPELSDIDEDVCLLQKSITVQQVVVPFDERIDEEDKSRVQENTEEEVDGEEEFFKAEHEKEMRRRQAQKEKDVALMGSRTSSSSPIFSSSAASNKSVQVSNVSPDMALKPPSISLKLHKVKFNPFNFSQYIVQKENQNTAAEIFAVTTNSGQDLTTLLNSLSLYASLLIAIILVFGLLRRCFPLVYTNNALEDSELDNALSNKVPDSLRPSSSYFGWIHASLKTTTDDVAEVDGLDQAMLLEFSNFSMYVLVNIGLPLLIVTCPLNYYLGEGGKYDKLGAFGMGNLPVESWAYWVEAVAVWYVVVRVQSLLFQAQAKFLQRRFEWMWNMKGPRGRTVLVQNIPEEYQSEEALKKLIDKDTFAADVVQRLAIVRSDQSLLQLQMERDQLRKEVRRMEGTAGESEAKEKLLNKRDELQRETLRLKGYADGAGGPTSNAFVTFKNRREAVVFSYLRITENSDEFLKLLPPEPTDVNYTALTMGIEWKVPMYIIGSLLVLFIFVLFIPIVAFISSFIKISNLAAYFPFILQVVEKYPIVMEWDTVAATLALNIVMGMLPFLMMTIFRTFIPSAWSSDAQLLLAKWYFRFQIIFVVILTSVGSSLLEVTAELVADPTTTIFNIAAALPATSHFYVNFFVLQWGTQGLQLLRLFNLVKFIVCVIIGYFRDWGDTTRIRAKELAEPEDQDGYGIGARSANSTLFLATALIYCNITPLITVVAFVAFGTARLVQGYLVVFAETRKSDSGGMFWNQQVHQMQYMMLIYIVFMAAIVYRSGGFYPGNLVFFSVFYQIHCMYRFDATFQVDHLSMEWVGQREAYDKQQAQRTLLGQSVSETIWSAVQKAQQASTEEPPELSYAQAALDKPNENENES